ncbi:hypothetical protein GCM10010259_55510 [Streptomyces daghestanicus]|nr:hypothetical protein GCM10010240_55880 [Streptomyces griseoviridis]GGU57389.1 hypothetical protein GCM10010259_55510 [Streptomyces daghestanicus]GHI35527.1 hypothetical protein Sdagh_72570 [Streptomyces daghestanicus]
MSMTGRSSPAARFRLTLLVLTVAAAGSPWAQRPLLDFYVREFYIERSGNDLLRWMVQAGFSPGWDLSAERYAGTAGLIANDLGILVLLALLTLVAPRLPARRSRRWPACLVAGVLTAGLASLVGLALFMALVEDAELGPAGVLATNLGRSALIFGSVLGVLLALLSTGRPGPGSGTRDARRAPHRVTRGRSMTTAPVAMPVGSAPGDVTRYLCAAAYVDEHFADRVVEDVLADETAAVAPSPGVDPAAVVRHCLAALELRYRRDLRLTAVFGAVAVLAPLWLTAVMVLLGAARLAGDRPRLATRGRRLPGGGALVRLSVSAGVFALLTLYVGVVLSGLPVDGFASWLLGTYFAGVPAALASVGGAVCAYLTVLGHDRETDRLLRTTLTRQTYRPPRGGAEGRPEWVAGRLAAVERAGQGNATVYSGYRPSVGWSETSAQWSLAVPLLPAEDPAGLRARPTAPRPFTAEDLIDHLRERLGSLTGAGPRDGEPPGGLVVEDRVLAAGTALGEDERFFAADTIAPVTVLADEAVREIMRRPTGTVRHCLAVHAELWGGDVVPATFLHVTTVGQTLHLHIDHHVLGPVRAAYHLVDRLDGGRTPAEERALLLGAASRTGRVLAAAPFRALYHARFETRHSRRMADEFAAARQDPLYDFGARTSIRELALSPDYHNYFQVMDAQRITSLIERHTLAAVREFLDSHGFDTTDFRAQQQTILNQGLIQQGGTSIIGNQAIGTGASATQTFPQQAGTTAPGAAGAPGR